MILILPLLLLAQAQEGSGPDTLESNWSFGVLYTPVSSDRIYQIYYYPYYDYAYMDGLDHTTLSVSLSGHLCDRKYRT